MEQNLIIKSFITKSLLNCHLCYLDRRETVTKFIECPNPECNKTYCVPCVEKNFIQFGKANCVFCANICCCSKSLCTLNHGHCEYYRTTQKQVAAGKF